MQQAEKQGGCHRCKQLALALQSAPHHASKQGILHKTCSDHRCNNEQVADGIIRSQVSAQELQGRKNRPRDEWNQKMGVRSQQKNGFSPPTEAVISAMARIQRTES
jgi:hypothetical protein